MLAGALVDWHFPVPPHSSHSVIMDGRDAMPPPPLPPPLHPPSFLTILNRSHLSCSLTRRCTSCAFSCCLPLLLPFDEPQVKIFLNASPAVRAQRRHAELEASGSSIPYEQVLHDIQSRDAADYSRPVGALKQVTLPTPGIMLISRTALTNKLCRIA
jgi:hypothetical protein